MAHRDDIGGFLCRHDARDLCDREHIALFDTAALDERHGIGLDNNSALGDRLTKRAVFLGDVHHFGATLFIDM